MTGPLSTAEGRFSSPGKLPSAARFAAIGFVVAALILAIAGVQAAGFYALFSPRLAEADQRLRDLEAETAERKLYGRLASGVRRLRGSDASASASVSPADAWHRFETRFAIDPEEAVRELRVALQHFDALEAAQALRETLDRLQTLYADPYGPLLEDLQAAPMYLRPAADVLAEVSGYRRTAELDRALHLALVGEIGTAYVILTGVRASTPDPGTLGKVHYLLGRVQFEMFRALPRTEYRLQAIEHVRQSLRADPDSDLAKRFLDYLLSLDHSVSSPSTLPGAPASRSENDGTPIPEGERRF